MGLALAEAAGWIAKRGDDLPKADREFIDLSLLREARERAQRRRQQRQRLAFRSIAAALVLLFAGAGMWWWDANFRIRTQYCTSYAERWGMPFCVGPIDGDAWQRRGVTYRIMTRGGQTLELARVNGSGNLRSPFETSYEGEDWDIGAARWVYTYRHEGGSADPMLASVVLFGNTGQRLRSIEFQFAENRRQAIARFDKDFGVAELQSALGSTLSPILPSRNKRSAIGQHRLFFDAGGLLEKRIFEPVGGGASRGDALGAHGRAYDHGFLGLIIGVRNLDQNGETLVEKTGIAEIRRDYDARGSLTAIEWWNNRGAPVVNDQAFARAVIARDQVGNLKQIDYFDAKGEPVLRKDWGIARFTRRFDERGNQVENVSFGVDGQLALRKDWGVARTIWSFDERGNWVETAYFGVDGQPILRKDWGIARMTARYDERGNHIAEAYFGIGGQPAPRKDWGIARVAWRYDERGNWVEAAYFGADGQPILHKDWGIARFTRRFDERGNQVENVYFGVDGQLALRKDWGVARTIWSFDERGNWVETAYFGVDGQPILRKDLGIARMAARYDERGNQVENVYFGVDGQLALQKDWGVARTIWSFDERGNWVEAAYFGVDGQPILRKDLGIARMTARYDERGNRVEVAYFDVDGRATARKDEGSARVNFRYDERATISEESFFDTNGNLAENLFGFARSTSERDALGRLIGKRYFDRDGKPILRANGLRKREEIQDLFGTWRRLVLSGALDKAALAKIGEGGFARIVQEFDARGNATRRAFFGLNDEPIAGLNGFADERVDYDMLSRPELLKPTLADSTSTPVASIWTRLRYDAAGEVTRIDYVAPDGHIVDGKQGFASIVIEPRPDGNGTRTVLKDAEGKVIAEQ
jgi:hypothetical protein